MDRKIEDVNYFDTYAPVVKITIRVLFATVVIYKLIIHQIEDKTTFLNEVLE